MATEEKKDEMLTDFVRVFDVMRVLPATINKHTVSKRDLMRLLDQNADMAHRAIEEYQSEILGIDVEQEKKDAIEEEKSKALAEGS